MKNFKWILIFLSLASCQTNQKEAKTEPDDYLAWEAIADKLIERSQLQSGEQILLVAQPGQFDPLVPFLKKAIEGKGASYIGTVSIGLNQPEDWKTNFTDSLLTIADVDLPLYLSAVDLGIMLPGATPADRIYGALQKVLQKGKGRTIHFHWAGAYSMNGKLMDTDSLIDEFYEDVLLNTDYTALASKQKEFEQAMRNNWIQVTTPSGTNIKFQIGSRPVTQQDGNASLTSMSDAVTLIDREIELPAGAIRVAPIEESVQGTIAFPDNEWQGKFVKGLVMKFEKGKVIEIIANEGREFVQQELSGAGEAGKSFREFALGFNPLLAIPKLNPWIPYYGYGAGVVRLSLGDNTELGGKVTGGYVRWNFFTDATVKVGEVIWVENGALLK